jgi:hypothetical protein
VVELTMTITEKGGGEQIDVPRGWKITHYVLARKKAPPSRQDSPRNAKVDFHCFSNHFIIAKHSRSTK